MAEQRYALALEASGAGTWYWDRRADVVDWDPALEAIYGLEPGSFAGGFDEWAAKIHPEDRDEVLATLRETMRTARPHHVLYRTVRPDGSQRWIEGRGQVLRDGGEVVGMIGACHDVTERILVASERERLLSAEQQARARLEFLAEASELLAQSLDVEELLAQLARLSVPRLGDWCAIDLWEDEQLRLVALEHTEPAKVDQAKALLEQYGRTELGARRAAETGRPECIVDISDDLLRAHAQNPQHHEALRSLGPVSSVAVPLRARGRILGTLTLVHAESGRRHSEEDVSLAQDLAQRSAVAIANAQLFTERSEVAETLQHALLPPELPRISGAELGAFYDSADVPEIGGDFYDVLGTGSDWTVVVGDVRGKGVRAASLTALARHTVRAGALSQLEPAPILGLLNDALLELEAPESFCTVVCGHLAMQDGKATLTLSSGGHPQPLVLRADGTVEPVACAGMLVGAFPDPEYEAVTVTLEPGDLVFFCTDGLTEARCGDDLFGQERVAQALASTAGMTAPAAVKHVHAAVEEFQSGQRDDMAMLAVRLLP